MMRGLFGYVVAACVIWVLPVAGKCLSEYGVEGLLHAAALGVSLHPYGRELEPSRRSNMPAAEIKFHHRNEALNGIIDFRHG